MKKYISEKHDEERAFYGQSDFEIVDCQIDGELDGESAFKECRDFKVSSSFFNLRYPFWHNTSLKIYDCEMTDKCRAALWYDKDVEIHSTEMHGIKALRECNGILLDNCDIISPEFGWSTLNVRCLNCTAESEYFFLRGANLNFSGLNFKGKYSFQYITDSYFENCIFDTKDAFWHSQNVTVKDSTIKGEYLAWYSENLTLINCKIDGTQPFCYCNNLKMINCEMVNTDLAFEKSTVNADVHSKIDSIKNPYGLVECDGVGEIIIDDPMSSSDFIIVR